MRPVSERPASSDSVTPQPQPQPPGPPPLRPFGLVLHHDGRFSHEGEPIRHRKLREHFERSVEYLADEQKFIVRLGHFRGQIEVEEAGFFVRTVELESARSPCRTAPASRSRSRASRSHRSTARSCVA